MHGVRVTIDTVWGHALVAIQGELDLSNVGDTEQTIDAAIAEHGPHLIVNMADLTFMDSTGLSVLVRVLKRARAKGGEVALVRPQGRVRRLLTVTGLLGVFPVYASVTDAARATTPQHNGGKHSDTEDGS
jgi:anti-anti-sigma factor